MENKMTEEIYNPREMDIYLKAFQEGKSQRTKEVLEVFDLWMRNSNLTFNPDVSYETDYARRINKYIEELKQQLKKLGEKE